MADPHWGPVEKHPAGADERRDTRSPGRRWTVRALKAIGLLTVLGLVAGVAVVVIGYRTVERPDPNRDFQTATTFVYYDDGKSELGSFAVQNRQPLKFDEMPDTIKEAVVAAENRSFWTDRGISVRGMFRAAWAIARGGEVQGGSTITQQYIKILYLNSEQTATRKFKELFLAYKINQEMSKEEILEDYLNTVYYGKGAYGVQAASQAYFDVDAKKLSVPQAAVLASVLKNPSALDPAYKKNRAALLERYRYTVYSMAETGAITGEQAERYAAKLPRFPDVKVNERYGGTKGFLLKMVQDELSDAGIDSRQVNGGGLKIITTFDKDAQAAAVESAQRYTRQAAAARDRKASNLHAAIASVDVDSGEVLALYGGPDYLDDSRNWATTPRPTASTFKTYAMAAGLEDDFNLYSSLQGNTFTPPGETSPVRNEFSYQYGPVSLLRATAESINTAFVDLITKMPDGGDKTLEVARDAGAATDVPEDLSPRNITLGVPEVSPLDQASAYATFANDGTHVASHVVKEVRDADDNVVYKANAKENRAVSEDVAHDVTYALSSVVDSGTGRAATALGRPVAGKTGTKDGVKDDVISSWFVGYTRQVSTAVMYVAGSKGTSDLDAYARPGDSTFFGGTYPALTWADYMATATEGQPVRQFEPPAFVNRYGYPQYGQPTNPQSSGPPTSSAPSQPGSSPSTSRSPSQPTPRPSASRTSARATDLATPSGRRG